MDELAYWGRGFEMKYPIVFVPEPYGAWQVQNYINDKLSDMQKAGIITQILSSVKDEDAKRIIDTELDKFKQNKFS